MKTKIILILLIAVSFGGSLFAQDSYQIFPSEGFKIKCGCKLYVNSTFIQMAQQQGNKDIIAAYICAENQDRPDYGVIVNINIYDESKSYKNIKPSNYAFFEKRCLEKYASNLSNAGYEFKYVNYQGISALEYNFDQMGLPTKALMFFKNKRSFLLQVATRVNLNPKFNALITSFQIL